jgi:hypothetical protein
MSIRMLCCPGCDSIRKLGETCGICGFPCTREFMEFYHYAQLHLDEEERKPLDVVKSQDDTEVPF